MKYFSNRKAWIEAISDTALGSLINFPLNIVILTITFELELTVLQTSVVLAVTFTILAIIRKYMVRSFFSKKVR